MKTNLVILAYLLLSISSCNDKEILPDEYHNVNQKSSSFKAFKIQMSFTHDPIELTVELVDSLAIIEGDIIVGTEEDFEQAGLAGIIGVGKLWEKATIPYEIQEGHSKKIEINKAIDYINLNTNLNIVPRSNEIDYVYFAKSEGCSSWVGKQGYKQNINIGKCSYGSIIHEILHASGFYHEQSRTDRDKYISIEFSNIKEKSRHNFKRYVDRGYSGNDIDEYDYNSIMHYRDKAFSINGKKTISLKVPPATSATIVGQRNGMSKTDIKTINMVYDVK
ncbi:M12 family metallopeptidase [Algoriphagus sp. NG3]|uniref:M12 family metallopeptidase n=1 Tax=Algoriphagus sp. NG3 TaxID=3097546 RepID=UPI002A838682|nr:M12 family metallopeptidase [Algoriphagus sp. NG3]WPR77712.1 M12 family metallopeptidase [Algoriphagus sp. NG3]